MSLNQTSLKSEIKRSLLLIDYKMMLTFAPVISMMCLMMVFAYHPELMDANLESHVGFLVSIIGFLVGSIMSVVVVSTVASFYKPKVMQYVDVPKDIEAVRDGLISLGSFVTTIENTINSEQIGKIFRHIAKELKKIPILQSKIKKLETTVKQQQDWIDYLTKKVVQHDQTIIGLKVEVKRLTEEKKESETIVADKIQGNNKIDDPKA